MAGSSVQGFSPLKTSIAFLLLNGLTVAQVPLTIRLLPRVNPRWMLAGSFALIALGDFWLSSQTATNFSLWPVVPGLALVGFGFALAVSSVTAAAPAAQKEKVAAAVAAVKSGPLGQNGVPATVPGPGGKPMPFNPLHSVAFHALDHAYNVGYFVCGAAAAVSFVLAAVALGGRRGASEPVSEGVTERHEPESALR